MTDIRIESALIELDNAIQQGRPQKERIARLLELNDLVNADDLEIDGDSFALLSNDARVAMVRSFVMGGLMAFGLRGAGDVSERI